MFDRPFSEEDLDQYSALLYRAATAQGPARLAAINALDEFKMRTGGLVLEAMWLELCKRDSVN